MSRPPTGTRLSRISMRWEFPTVTGARLKNGMKAREGPTWTIRRATCSNSSPPVWRDDFLNIHRARRYRSNFRPRTFRLYGLIYPDRYKSEVNDVEMDSTLLMHAYTCGVCCFPPYRCRSCHARRNSGQNQPAPAGGAAGGPGGEREKGEDGGGVRAHEPRRSAPVHQRFRSRVPLPQSRSANLGPAELIESYF